MNFQPVSHLILVGLLLIPAACSQNGDPLPASRYDEPDKLYRVLQSNILATEAFEVIAQIDHSRLGAEAGSPMPPARVLIWSDPVLEAAILAQKPLAGLDLPLRVLVYEEPSSGEARVATNDFGFLSQRHGLPHDPGTAARYASAVGKALRGIPRGAVTQPFAGRVRDGGLIVMDSPHDFAATRQRALDAINAQSDTLIFAEVDFSARSARHGAKLPPTRLLLFGAPGPGAKAMAQAPLLGLNAFCQKLLIWQDGSGAVRMAFNDLSALAEQVQAPTGVALRIIDHRMNQVFLSALE